MTSELRMQWDFQVTSENLFEKLRFPAIYHFKIIFSKQIKSLSHVANHFSIFQQKNFSYSISTEITTNSFKSPQQLQIENLSNNYKEIIRMHKIFKQKIPVSNNENVIT